MLLVIDIQLHELINTITKFSNVTGYKQPDLSINWTPSVRVMLNRWFVRFSNFVIVLINW